jgi:formylglycine-generating enzyme required for sulfatase activity
MGNPTPKTRWNEEYSEFEQPVHSVTVSAFEIGKYPVTVEEFLPFAQAFGNADKLFFGCWDLGPFFTTMDPLRRDSDGTWQMKKPESKRCPMVGVTWYGAYMYCRWLSLMTGDVYRLPTEAEWEFAARGTEGRAYPWSNEPPNATRGFGYDSQGSISFAVDAYPRGATPKGVHGLVGGYSQWCMDYAGHTYSSTPQVNPRGPSRAPAKSWWDLVPPYHSAVPWRVVRGGHRTHPGSFHPKHLIGRKHYVFVKAWSRDANYASMGFSHLVFRVVREFSAEKPCKQFRSPNAASVPETVRSRLPKPPSDIPARLPARSLKFAEQQVASGFEIAGAPVTVEEYLPFVEAFGNPDELFFTANDVLKEESDGTWQIKPGSHRSPMPGVTWYGADMYCRWLSLLTGRTYRPPVQAENEPAPR